MKPLSNFDPTDVLHHETSSKAWLRKIAKCYGLDRGRKPRGHVVLSDLFGLVA